MQFKNLIGNIDIANTLTQLTDEGRVSHTQLFVGRDGYGGLPTAMAFAQYINCEDKQHFQNTAGLRADSCGKCPSCRKYEKFIHPDLHLYFPNTTTKKVTEKNSSDDFITEFRTLFMREGGYFDLPCWYEQLNVENKQAQINVRDVQSLLQELSLTNYEARFKVCILWHVEKLNVDSAPRLLKSLEEPPENTLCLLLTDDVEHILPTILSRTQQLHFRPLPHDAIEQSLLLKYSNHVSHEDLHKAAIQSEGDYLKALSLLSTSEEEKAFQEMFVRWMRSVFQYRKNIGLLSDVVAEIAKWGREELKRFLQYTLDTMRVCFQWSLGIEPKILPFDSVDRKFREFFPRFIHAGNISEITQSVEDGIAYIMRNANAKVVLMELSITIGNQLRTP